MSIGGKKWGSKHLRRLQVHLPPIDWLPAGSCPSSSPLMIPARIRPHVCVLENDEPGKNLCFWSSVGVRQRPFVQPWPVSLLKGVKALCEMSNPPPLGKGVHFQGGLSMNLLLNLGYRVNFLGNLIVQSYQEPLFGIK